MRDRPQVLLIGNGLNLAFNDGFSWNAMLKDIRCNPSEKLPKDPRKFDCPMPLKAIVYTNDNIEDAIKEFKNENTILFGEVNDDRKRQIFQNILGIGFDDILTTNYSYELEIAGLNTREIKETALIKISTHTNKVDRVEPKYLLHSYNELKSNGLVNRIWHIHGEARKTDSMILGHYYYANLLGRMTEYLSKNSKRYERLYRSEKVLELQSWIDSFILGDVYILGFGFDLSEFDLWWLLNRKKRERAPHGRVYFFDTYDEKSDVRNELLKTLGVEIMDLGIRKPPENDSSRNEVYIDFYNKALERIKSIATENITTVVGG